MFTHPDFEPQVSPANVQPGNEREVVFISIIIIVIITIPITIIIAIAITITLNVMFPALSEDEYRGEVAQYPELAHNVHVRLQHDGYDAFAQ